MRSFSMSTARAPKTAAAVAAETPPAPAPMTQMSGLSSFAISRPELTGLEVNFGVKSSWLYCRRGANAADPIMDIPYISLAGQMTLGKSERGAWRTLARPAVALTSHEGSRISRANRAARALN